MNEPTIPTPPLNPTRLTFEEWFTRFQPVKNHLAANASHDGYMFETYGAELDFIHSVRADSPGSVWTITSSGDYTTLGDGYHYVDRMGYFFTSVPCPDNECFEIVLDEPTFEVVDIGGGSYQVFDREQQKEFCIVNSYDGEPLPAEERAELIRESLEMNQ